MIGDRLVRWSPIAYASRGWSCTFLSLAVEKSTTSPPAASLIGREGTAFQCAQVIRGAHTIAGLLGVRPSGRRQLGPRLHTIPAAQYSRRTSGLMCGPCRSTSGGPSPGCACDGNWAPAFTQSTQPNPAVAAQYLRDVATRTAPARSPAAASVGPLARPPWAMSALP